MAFRQCQLCLLIALLLQMVGALAVDPGLQLQGFLQEYSGDVRLRTIPVAPAASFFNSMLQSMPVEPPQYAGQCNVTYDANSSMESRFGVLLPPSCFSEAPKLPSVSDIWQQLLLRETFQEENEVGINFLLVSWADWFLNDVFMTRNNTNGTFSELGTPLSLGNLYGRTSNREAALRSFVDGKMKVSSFNGEDYPPFLSTVQRDFPSFTMDVPDQTAIITDANGTSSANFFALGDPRYNIHIGHLHWSTLFLRLHNSLCGMLLEGNPQMSDQQVYETARLIVTHVVVKVIWQEYIGKAISSFRDYAGMEYDPSVLRNLGVTTLENKIYFEFNQLSQWHALIPDVLNLNGGTPFLDLVYQPQALLQAPLNEITQAFMNTSAGRMSAKNIPSYLGAAAAQTMLDARAQRLQGFNAYRAAYGLPKFTQFEDFGLNASLTESLRSLYNNQIDDVEWYVGLMVAEPHVPNTFLSETMLVSGATFAFSALLNLDVVKNPALWQTERLTPAGKAFIQSITLSSLLGVDQEVPFFRSDRQPHWHTVDSADGWVWHNLVHFVGYDYVIAPFFTDGTYFHTIFTTTLVCAIVLIFAFFAVHTFWMLLGRRTLYPTLSGDKQLITTTHTIFGLLLMGQLVPYTYYLLPLLFKADFVDRLPSTYLLPFTCFILHGIMYVAEATTRVVIKANQLLLWHHSLFLVLLFIGSLKESIFAIKLGLILDYFVCWEFALYLVLLAHRLKAKPIVQRCLLVFAFVTYGVSRVVQAVLLLAFFIWSSGRMQGQLGVYIVELLMACVLVVLQTYTFFIYWGIWKQASVKQGSPPEDPPEDQHAHVDLVMDIEIGVRAKPRSEVSNVLQLPDSFSIGGSCIEATSSTR